MFNRLLTRAYRSHMSSVGWPVDEGRRSGRSTAIALAAIAEAISSPGTCVPLIDHHGDQASDKCLRYLTQEIVGRLELQYLTINAATSPPTIRSDLYTNNPWSMING